MSVDPLIVDITYIIGLAAAVSSSEVLTRLKKIESAVVPKVIYHTGSSVKSDDFQNIFNFNISSFDVGNKQGVYSWNTEEFNSFKSIVKAAIISKVDKFISYANSPDKHEISALRPVLNEMLRELVQIAFDSFPDIDVVVEAYSYCDGRIKGKKGQLVVYNGETDLSCVAKPHDIPVCGFENKISKQSLVCKRIKVDDINAFGKKAMCQTATQILGAVNRFHMQHMSVPIYSLIGTNGWQYTLVRRILIDKVSGPGFFATVPVSIGTFSGGSIVAKPRDDPSYEIVAYLISLMFDNARYLLKRLKETSAIEIPLHALRLDNESFDDEDDENDDHLSSFDDLPSTEDAPSHYSKPSSTQQRGSSKDYSEACKRTALGEINTNILPVTASALRYHSRYLA
jgi:hypothetical protein